MIKALIVWLLGLSLIVACSKDEFIPSDQGDLSEIPYSPTAYVLRAPAHFPRMLIPDDNPMTDQGVLLGRRLFFDPILSSDGSMSCGS